MSKPRDEQVSQLRQRLRRTELDRASYVARILHERGPMIRGAFVAQTRRCGKSNCKCTRGEPHPITVLSASQGGRTCNTYVPSSDRARVKRLSQSYQRFRQARAELGKLAGHAVKIIDALQELLTEPYPPPTESNRGRGKGERRSRRKR